MGFSMSAAALALVLAAEIPLPQLRVEATDGGSVLYVRNAHSQPLAAFLVELVGYPGSSFRTSQDHLAPEAMLAPGGERRIPISNMTVGAAPEYVKMQAALYADGGTSGVPQKVALLVECRRARLAAAREAIRRIEKARSAAEAKADLSQWAESMKLSGSRNSTAAITAVSAVSAVSEAISALEKGSVEDALARLRQSERLLAASKPPL